MPASPISYKERRCSGCTAVAGPSEAIVYEAGFEHRSRLKRLKVLPQITVTVQRVIVKAIVYKRRESWQAEKYFQADARSRE